MNLWRSQEEIAAKFDELEKICDPRGHGLLRELRSAMFGAATELTLDDRIISLYARAVDATNESRVSHLRAVPSPGHSVKV